MRIVTGGSVQRNMNEKSANVDKIEFPTAGEDPLVPNGTTGTLWLVNLPTHVGPYSAGDELQYSDSNHNNDSTLTVNSVVGPTKYKITKTA